ncbi:cobaltochelatase subunit CobN [Leptolyngbya sp. AN02str]|uniref:cobaltochelatase subunit CobN n=1 Tax=Leptolyngbya sp. AN02str TaxID=3423363 RepID=UPI003D31BE88
MPAVSVGSLISPVPHCHDSRFYMHRLAATPGGWTPDADGVIFLEQTPAPLIVLTAADTDIQLLARARTQLPSDFPEYRVANLLQLQQQLTIDTYAEEVLEKAEVIVLRLLGGQAYWPYGLEVVQQTIAQTGATLLVIPGDDRPDPALLSHSTVPLAVVNQFWRYMTEGGLDNMVQGLQFLSDRIWNTSYHPAAPQPVPMVGQYPWREPSVQRGDCLFKTPCPKVGILFYRAHYLAGNLEPIEMLCQALSDRGLEPVPVYVSSLRDPDVQSEMLDWFQPKEQPGIDVLLNATSFSLARLDAETHNVALWERLNVPVLQLILSGGTLEQWKGQTRGLAPRDVAMNVALPEVDGRIISRAISFKSVQAHHPQLEVDVVGYAAVGDRIQFVADMAAHWVQLRHTPVGDRRIALILANYPTRDGRLANGVGLDTPQSCVEILKALHAAGYTVGPIPSDGDALIQQLTRGRTNDPEGAELRAIAQSLSLPDYAYWFQQLPQAVQADVCDRWGSPEQAIAPTQLNPAQSNNVWADGVWADGVWSDTAFPIAGVQLGNVFVGIQPARGYDQDPSLNYHAPDLQPTHHYLAFYQWVRSHFGAHAVVHVGKHGNLEWLPGKSVALSNECYPEVAFGALPHFYPFIVNDPGEGSQAKRRAQAVIIDHLTPPLTRAELYGNLHQLEALVDEYYEAQTLDPTRLPTIRDRILTLLTQENLQQELGLSTLLPTPHSPLPTLAPRPQSLTPLFSELLTRTDTYLCDLKEAQIRDGLHIFGQCPTGRQLRDLVVAIARHPTPNRPGLTRAIAAAWNFQLDPLTAKGGEPLAEPDRMNPSLQGCRTVGDAIERMEQTAAHWVDAMLSAGNMQSAQLAGLDEDPATQHPAVQDVLSWIVATLIPVLQQTQAELTHLLHGLNGGYVPSGASGAPTRGRPEVLPTGRNFYSVDIRAIPTESAWDVGRKSAEALVERYAQEHGEFPKTLGLSAWGTSCMRTGGDDLAQAMALLGVRPVWEGASRRVVDFEIIPLSLLGRPRVDVTLRISGFFRDAFPNLIDLFDQAVQAVAALDEPEEQNPLAARSRQETEQWQAAGLEPDQALERSRYRIFGSKPGAYGAGLQGLIEAQNWTSDEDLARAYLNWSGYAYSRSGNGRPASEAFEQRLRNLQIVLHNQDNREHDLLDSDDYYQFQGGMTAAVRSLSGQNPHTYFGDHSLPQHPRIRTLSEEIARVYRSRVVNPKWIAGVMRHGYKGAFEMAATVDYLFAYDATARCVEDFMYQGIADAYLFDPQVQAFVQAKNPWVLRDMAERLLEAHQRGLWQTASSDTLEALKQLANQAEGAIEEHP